MEIELYNYFGDKVTYYEGMDTSRFFVKYADYKKLKQDLEDQLLAYKCLQDEYDTLESEKMDLLKEKLKPFVLKSEMDNKVGLIESMYKDKCKELEELQDAIASYMSSIGFYSTQDRKIIENAIKASKRRRGDGIK